MEFVQRGVKWLDQEVVLKLGSLSTIIVLMWLIKASHSVVLGTLQDEKKWRELIIDYCILELTIFFAIQWIAPWFLEIGIFKTIFGFLNTISLVTATVLICLDFVVIKIMHESAKMKKKNTKDDG